MLCDDLRGELSQAAGEGRPQLPVLCQPYFHGRDSVGESGIPWPTPKELHKALCLRHPPCGAPLPPVVTHLHAGSKPRMVSVPRPCQPGRPTAHCGESREGVYSNYLSLLKLLVGGTGSGVARLEGDSFWKLSNVISPKETSAMWR